MDGKISQIECSNQDKKLQQIAYQLFGEPVQINCTCESDYVYTGPFVKLSSSKLTAGADCGWKNLERVKSSRGSLVTQKKTSNAGRAKFLSSRRCLICYSITYENDDGECIDLEELVKSLVTSSSSSSVDDLDELGDLEETIRQLLSLSISCLCPICTFAGSQYLIKQQTIMKLQRQVDELRQKFISAIVLSMQLAEKESQSRNNYEGHRDLIKIVDRLRTYLLHGNKSKIIPVEVKEEPPEDLGSESESDGFVTSNDSDSDDTTLSETTKSSVVEKLTIKDEVDNSMDAFEEQEFHHLSCEETIPTVVDPMERKKMMRRRVVNNQHRRLRQMFPHLKRKEAWAAYRQQRLESGGEKHAWRREQGKFFYRDAEIKKNDEDSFLCPFECKSRATSYKTIDILKRHVRIFHIDSSDKSHKCERCDERFFYKQDLERHIQNKHLGGYQCDRCPVNLTSAKAIRKHVEIAHLKISSHICDICGRLCGTKQHLTVHLKTHSSERLYTCSACGDTFAQSCTLNNHLRKKHPELIDPLEPSLDEYPCNICGANMKSPYALCRHKNVKHRGIKKKHVCEDCGKAFQSGKDLSIHIIRLHSFGAKPIVCHLCAKGFAIRCDLDSHLRRFHKLDRNGEPLQVKKSKRQEKTNGVKCDICGNMFSSRSSLCHHKKAVHLKVRRHTCDHCDRRFYTKFQKMDHLKTHIKDTPLPCPICSKPFSRKYLLKCHIKLKHPEVAEKQTSSQLESLEKANPTSNICK